MGIVGSSCKSFIFVPSFNILLSFIKQNDDKYVIDDFGYNKIYGFLNSLEERSFYFAEEPFEEDNEYVEFDIWWNNLSNQPLDVVFTNTVKNWRAETITSDYYRKVFTKNTIIFKN